MKIIRRFIEAVKKLKEKKYIWIPATILFWLMPAFYLFEAESFHTYPVNFIEKFLPERISVVLFDLILFYILFAIIFFLVKKPWICLTVFGVLMTAVSFTNYIKYSLTGDNFFPHDIVMAGNMNELVGFMSIAFAWWMWAFIIGAVLAAVILGIFAKDAPFKFYIRIPAALVLSAAIFLFFANGSFAGNIFNKFKMSYETASRQSENYDVNGFVGAFSINIAAFSIQKPEGYSDSALESAMSVYNDIPPSADFQNEKPDIILVLSESFWDPRLLPDSLFSPNPLENFDEISQRENAYSGKLFVPAFGGGTIRTEFEVLTGLTCDALPSGVIPYNIINKNIGSYVSYYKNLGYYTLAIHPYLQKFYNRNICLPYIGFDEFYGIESLDPIYDVDRIEKGGYTSDESFVEYVKYFLRESETKSEQPLFLFGITMENHQPYRYKFDNTKFTISAYDEKLNAGDQHNLEHYTQGVQDADKSLGQLAEFIDGRQRPTVLIFFGDHLPSISTDGAYSAFTDTGFVDNYYMPDARKRLYATPFVIYANFPLNKDVEKYDTVASYDLLNVLSSLTGAGKTKYMEYLDALRKVLPYYNSRTNIKLEELTQEQRDMLKIQYFETYKTMK